MQCDTGEQREFSELREESHGEKNGAGLQCRKQVEIG